MGRLPRVPKAYSRSKRKMQILNTFKIWAQHNDLEPKAITTIGNAIGMRSSPHLRDILFEMANDDDLQQFWRDEEGKLGAYVFLLAEKHIITEKYSRRHISVKSRGQAVGQLEMFS